MAAKCLIPHQEDGVVIRVPSEEELRRIAGRFPGTQIRLDVEPGTHLGELPNQDSYRYNLGEMYLGADDREQLQRIYEECLAALNFEFRPIPPDTSSDSSKAIESA